MSIFLKILGFLAYLACLTLGFALAVQQYAPQQALPLLGQAENQILNPIDILDERSKPVQYLQYALMEVTGFTTHENQHKVAIEFIELLPTCDRIIPDTGLHWEGFRKDDDDSDIYFKQQFCLKLTSPPVNTSNCSGLRTLVGYASDSMEGTILQGTACALVIQSSTEEYIVGSAVGLVELATNCKEIAKTRETGDSEKIDPPQNKEEYECLSNTGSSLGFVVEVYKPNLANAIYDWNLNVPYFDGETTRLAYIPVALVNKKVAVTVPSVQKQN